MLKTVATLGAIAVAAAFALPAQADSTYHQRSAGWSHAPIPHGADHPNNNYQDWRGGSGPNRIPEIAANPSQGDWPSHMMHQERLRFGESFLPNPVTAQTGEPRDEVAPTPAAIGATR